MLALQTVVKYMKNVSRKIENNKFYYRKCIKMWVMYGKIILIKFLNKTVL